MSPITISLILFALCGYVVYRAVWNVSPSPHHPRNRGPRMPSPAVPVSLLDLRLRMMREGDDFLIQTGRAARRQGDAAKRYQLGLEAISKKVPLSNLMRESGFVARLNGEMRGQCPGCADFQLTWTVVRTHNHFVCESCAAEGGSFEFLLLLDPDLRFLLNRAYAVARFGMVLEMAHVIEEMMDTHLLRFPKGGGGSAGKAARRDPRGPWQPKRPGPMATAASCELESEYELVAS